ncbi:MAG: Lrp/AsnC ligand binding domain-containing protein [Chloroflexota bacterium]|nr:Lrp/AsnC ligand binding domain-containing protein [Chloroflexota bacterium]
MIQALVLIKVERSSIPHTAEQLLEIKGITEVFSVTGEYDLVAMIRLKEYEDLALVVTEKIAKVETILKTETMLAFKVYSRADLEQSWQIGVD